MLAVDLTVQRAAERARTYEADIIQAEANGADFGTALQTYYARKRFIGG